MKTILFALLLLPTSLFAAYLDSDDQVLGSPTAYTCILEISQPNINGGAYLRQNCGSNEPTQVIGQWSENVDKLQLQAEVIAKLRPYFTLVSSSSTTTLTTMVFQKR